jgi:hypothetical protein
MIWLEAAGSRHCFPVRIELVVERRLPENQFSRWRKAHFVSNRPLQLI